jgi:hypothetical protein
MFFLKLNEKHDKNIQIEREKIALNSRLLNLKVRNCFLKVYFSVTVLNFSPNICLFELISF